MNPMQIPLDRMRIERWQIFLWNIILMPNDHKLRMLYIQFLLTRQTIRSMLPFVPTTTVGVYPSHDTARPGYHNAPYCQAARLSHRAPSATQDHFHPPTVSQNQSSDFPASLFLNSLTPCFRSTTAHPPLHLRSESPVRPGFESFQDRIDIHLLRCISLRFPR